MWLRHVGLAALLSATPALADDVAGNHAHVISTRPQSLGKQGNPDRFFEGDSSKTIESESMRVFDADPTHPVMGKPSGPGAYAYTPEAEPHVLVYDYASGWNELSNDQGGGRTGANAYDTRLWNRGQGDLTAYYSVCHLGSAKAGATHFLASPACSIMAGGVGADPAAIGGLLQGYEIHLTDNYGPGTGTESAALGGTFDLNRQSTGTSLYEIWGGHRVQSTGTAAADFGYVVAGAFKNGFDTSPATLGAGQAAFVMTRNQRLYFDATAPTDPDGVRWYGSTLNSTYVTFNGSLLTTVVAANPTLQVGARTVTVAGSLGTSGIMSEPLGTPASSSAACMAGQFQDDANYHYVCTATNHWRRVALSDF